MNNNVNEQKTGQKLKRPAVTKTQLLLRVFFVMGVVFFCFGFLYPSLGAESWDEPISKSEQTVMFTFMGLGIAILLLFLLYGALLVRKARLKGETARSQSAGERTPSSRDKQKRNPQIRGLKDTLAGIGGGIVLILVGVWALVWVTPRYELINAPDSLIPIAGIFNIGLGIVWLWKIVTGEK